jgi:hypothetical protein
MPGEGCALRVASIVSIAGGGPPAGVRASHVCGAYCRRTGGIRYYPSRTIIFKVSRGLLWDYGSYAPSLKLFIGIALSKKKLERPMAYILSDPISIQRGLRQGCPASPILFGVLTNDIFDGIERLGCEVPGCVDMLDSRHPLWVLGQVFVNTVGLAPSLDNLHTIFAQWAEDHCMGFEVEKCGVIAPGRFSNEVALREHALRWQLGWERLPIVSKYIHLGAFINSYLIRMRNIVGDIWG